MPPQLDATTEKKGLRTGRGMVRTGRHERAAHGPIISSVFSVVVVGVPFAGPAIALFVNLLSFFAHRSEKPAERFYRQGQQPPNKEVTDSHVHHRQ